MSGVQLYQISSSSIFLDSSANVSLQANFAFTGGFQAPIAAGIFQASAAVLVETTVVNDVGYYSQLSPAAPEQGAVCALYCDTTSAVLNSKPIIKFYSGNNVIMTINCNTGLNSVALAQALPCPTMWIKDLKITITQQAPAADVGSFTRLYMIKSRVLY